jgi:hypothetical protein
MKALNTTCRLPYIGLGIGIVLLCHPGLATAVEPDIGMVIRLTSKVMYWHEGFENNPMKVQTFMKVRPKDYFKLAPHSVVQLVYFSNGRKETWTGPGLFRIGESGSEPVGEPGSSGEPKVMSLPASVVDEVRQVSPLIDPSRLHRSGGVQLRGGPTSPEPPLEPMPLTEEQKQEIAEAEAVYRSLLTKVEADDILPELYMFSVLADFDQFPAMRALVEKMKKKQPDNLAIDRLDEWIAEQGG